MIRGRSLPRDAVDDGAAQSLFGSTLGDMSSSQGAMFGSPYPQMSRGRSAPDLQNEVPRALSRSLSRGSVGSRGSRGSRSSAMSRSGSRTDMSVLGMPYPRTLEELCRRLKDAQVQKGWAGFGSASDYVATTSTYDVLRFTEKEFPLIMCFRDGVGVTHTITLSNKGEIQSILVPIPSRTFRRRINMYRELVWFVPGADGSPVSHERTCVAPDSTIARVTFSYQEKGMLSAHGMRISTTAYKHRGTVALAEKAENDYWKQLAEIHGAYQTFSVKLASGNTVQVKMPSRSPERQQDEHTVGSLRDEIEKMCPSPQGTKLELIYNDNILLASTPISQISTDKPISAVVSPGSSAASTGKRMQSTP